jgi:hypothetical protein
VSVAVAANLRLMGIGKKDSDVSLLRTLVLPSLSTSVLTDMFTLVLLCLYGVVVGVADLVTDFP